MLSAGLEKSAKYRALVTRPTDVRAQVCLKIETGGAQGRNRTADTVIFSHVLYQLSYLGLPRTSGSQRL